MVNSSNCQPKNLTVFAQSDAAATKCFILQIKEATVRERLQLIYLAQYNTYYYYYYSFCVGGVS